MKASQIDTQDRSNMKAFKMAQEMCQQLQAYTFAEEEVQSRDLIAIGSQSEITSIIFALTLLSFLGQYQDDLSILIF